MKLLKRNATTATYVGCHWNPPKRRRCQLRRTLRLISEIFGFIVITTGLWFALLYFAAEAYVASMVGGQ